MGRVDKLDFLLSLYSIHIQSKSNNRCSIYWTSFIYLLLPSGCNIEETEFSEVPKTQQMNFLQFRCRVAECMIKCDLSVWKKDRIKYKCENCNYLKQFLY